MPPRPLMAGGCDSAVVFPACSRLCICVKIGSRPVKNGLRWNGTFQADTCSLPIEVVPVALDGLTKEFGGALAFKSLIALLMPLITSSKASSCVGHLLTGFPCEGSIWSLAKGASFQSVGRRMMGMIRA